MVHTDEILVRRYLEGDRQAFRDLVERHTPVVFNIASRLTGDRDDASDITQEAFRRVFEALPTSRLDLPFKPWLLQITVNLCRDWAKRRRAITWTSQARPDDPDDAEDMIDALLDTAPLPAEALEQDETRQAVWRAIDTLPDAYRTVILLRYGEDLSYQDIAATLDLPLNTVRTHLLRAKKLLQTRLQSELEG